MNYKKNNEFMLTVICPMHNEQNNLPVLFKILPSILTEITNNWELILIDDGSIDNSFQIAKDYSLKESRVRAIALSRNFGKEIALACGLHNAKGDAVVLMDADLQHPAELIREFVDKWQNGYDMIYGIRSSRDTDGKLRKLVSNSFYKIFSFISNTNLPSGAGDFRLLDRKVVNALNQMPERNRFTKGLYSWVGFRQIGIEFEMQERNSGNSKWGMKKLFGLAIDGITAFSIMPLRIWTYIGLFVSSIAFLYAIIILAETIIYGVAVPGFPSLIISVMLLSGIQLISLGVLGEYLGRVFTEVKARPMYFIAHDTADKNTR